MRGENIAQDMPCTRTLFLQGHDHARRPSLKSTTQAAITCPPLSFLAIIEDDGLEPPASFLLVHGVTRISPIALPRRQILLYMQLPFALTVT